LVPRARTPHTPTVPGTTMAILPAANPVSVPRTTTTTRASPPIPSTTTTIPPTTTTIPPTAVTRKCQNQNTHCVSVPPGRTNPHAPSTPTHS
jgi:hypothetical protein